MTIRLMLLAALSLALAGCGGSKVRVTSAPEVQTRSRSEPIFYNGKTYQLDYSYVEGTGAFDMEVSGMGAKQKQDAVAVATSSLGYYACPEGQKGRLTGEAAYVSSKWRLRAACG